MLLFSWEKYEALESQPAKVKRPIHFLTNPLLTQHSTVTATTEKLFPAGEKDFTPFNQVWNQAGS